MVATIYCIHCGAVAKHPVYKTINGESLAFCCGGCVEVYEMMHEEGLDLSPIQPEAADPSPAVKQPDNSAPSQIVTYHVAGMTCANCVATVERRLRTVSGVMDVHVILETERATVTMIPDKVSFVDLKRAVEKAGYEISPEAGA